MMYIPILFKFPSLIARFMGPMWGPPGAARAQVGPMLATRTLLSGIWWNMEAICKGHHYDNHWYYEMVSNFSIVSFQVLPMTKVKGIEERHFDSLKSRARYIIHINFNFTFHCRFFMMTSSKWNHFPRYWPFVTGNSLLTGEFPSQRPVTWSFDVFFDLCLHKRLNKHLWGCIFEMPLCSLWRHCNVLWQG